MHRREFITLLGGSAAAGWPLAARAQQPTMPVIGWLSGRSPDESAYLVTAFRQRLAETSFVEGQNVMIEYRWASGGYDRLSALADDLVSRQVAVVAATGGVQSALAAKAATATIPIAFMSGIDPVSGGLVTSLNRPTGNLTGVTFLTGELAAKRLQLLREVAPATTIVGMLVNPNNPNAKIQSRDAQEAGSSLGLQVYVMNASSNHEIDMASATLARLRVQALLIGADPFFTSQRDHLIAFAMRSGLPAMYDINDYTAAGGLISYGANLPDVYRQTGVYCGKILKGAKPADLPIVQPTKFELVINLKTAKALGVAIPDKVLALADEVIE